MNVRLWAPDHPRGCAICLLDGRIFCVPCDQAGIETPKAFLRAAVARGCLPVGMEPEDAEPDTFRRATMIGEAARNAVTNAKALGSMTGQTATSRPSGVDPDCLARPKKTAQVAANVSTPPAILRDPTADRILHRLRRASDTGLTRTEISGGVFKRNLPAARIGAALELLRGSGRATCETVSTAGRPTEVWRATE